MTEWNDFDADGDAAQFFRRGGQKPGAPCPSPELVQAARMGTLPPHVQDRVAAHIEHCVVCQALGDALDDPSVAELRPDEQDRILERIHAGAQASTRTRRVNRLWQFGAAAAVVSLLIAGTVLVRQSRRQAPPAPAAPQVAAKAPRPPAPLCFSCRSLRFDNRPPVICCGAGQGAARAPTISREHSTLCERTISKRPRDCSRCWLLVSRAAQRRSSTWA